MAASILEVTSRYPERFLYDHVTLSVTGSCIVNGYLPSFMSTVTWTSSSTEAARPSSLQDVAYDSKFTNGDGAVSMKIEEHGLSL
jgi:hypothetical protein